MEHAPIHDETTAIAHALRISDPANGDDAAIVRLGGGSFCISTDSTIAGVHAPLATSPHVLGRRAAARALSDLAAMGALPVGITCAIHVPKDGWADATAALDGVAERAGEQHAPLLGGDFTRTPSDALALVVTVLGRRAGAPRGAGYAPRAAARLGDELHVTGSLGAAAHALATGALATGAGSDAITLPEPPARLRAGSILARHARAMIDLSDGLARDASLLVTDPALTASIELERVPCAPGVDDPRVAAAGGDDYELLIAIAPERIDAARAELARACPELVLTRIGCIADSLEAHLFTLDGVPVNVPIGFVHT
ncbi:MAG: thiamine-phosphate kinase [Gaiellales bacterium]